MTQTAPEASADPHDDLVERIRAELATLGELLPFVRDLLEPARGQRAMLRPKPSDAELARRDQRHLQERAGQLENLRSGITLVGPAPIPASVEGLDAAVTISALLVGCENRIRRSTLTCAMPDVGTDEARLQRVSREVDLVVDVAVLRRILTDVVAAVRAAEHLVDGEPSRRLNARCPYCHGETLVVYQRDPRGRRDLVDTGTPTEAIRCDKPLGADCVCSSETCPCKRREPGGRQTYRHTWTRDRGGWDALASLLEKHAEQCAVCRG